MFGNCFVVVFANNSEWFTSSGIFKVPSGVTSLRVIVVGGGGGGTNGHHSGGAGGYVKCATLKVQSDEEITVTVGSGGSGAKTQKNNNDVVGCTPGESSSFGTELVAAGGGACKKAVHGNKGGTGSGAACWTFWPIGTCSGPGSIAGAGGSNGSNGCSASDGRSGGRGQGDEYSRCLKTAKNEKLSDGAGGAAGEANCRIWPKQCWGAAGGGGGVLINGEGPTASDGVSFFLIIIKH